MSVSLAVAVACLPIYNPDVFWHLSAARWIFAHASIPVQETFTFTRYGAPWIDFEWGTQILWGAVEAVGGLWGLWVLKIILVGAAAWPVDGVLRDRGASTVQRAAALTVWLAAMVSHCDLRADLSSAVLFAVLVRRREARRGSFLFGFVLFALWANLHGGFLVGLALFAVYAVAERSVSQELAAEACGAAFGTLLNPYGLSLWSVMRAHAATPEVRNLIAEWMPPSARHANHIPLLVVLAVTAVWACLRREPRSARIAAVLLGGATAISARFACYFAPAAAIYLGTVWPKKGLNAAMLATVALAVAVGIPQSRMGVRLPFQDLYVARRAVDFVAREQAALGGLRLFNQYEWGGYLGWRLGLDARIFGDGRYLFLDQIEDIQTALTGPGPLAGFAARNRLDGFLIRRYEQTLPTTRRYADGTTKSFARPWFIEFLPRTRWALVYWDAQALLFVDRDRIPATWLAAHEYRWLLPGDRDARLDALQRGEIPRRAYDLEAERHRVEADSLQ